MCKCLSSEFVDDMVLIVLAIFSFHYSELFTIELHLIIKEKAFNL